MAKPKKKLKMEDIKKNNDVEVMSTIERIKLHEREYLLVTTAIFMVIIALVLFVLFGGFDKNSDLNILKIGNLNVEYDSNMTGASDVITLTEDNVVENEKEVEDYATVFSVSNASKGKHKFKAFIVADQTMIDLDGCGDKLVNDNAIFFQINDGKIRSLYDVKTSDGYLILEDEIIGTNVNEYELKLWILKEKMEDENKSHFHGNIVIEEIEEE